MFFVWFSANFNVLAFGTGSAGPAFFDLGLRDTLIILVIVDAMYVALFSLFTADYEPEVFGTSKYSSCSIPAML